MKTPRTGIKAAQKAPYIVMQADTPFGGKVGDTIQLTAAQAKYPLLHGHVAVPPSHAPARVPPAATIEAPAPVPAAAPDAPAVEEPADEPADTRRSRRARS